MKLRVERDVLADSVAWAARTLPSRPSLPVLAGLVLTATEAGLHAEQLRLRGLRSGRHLGRCRHRGHLPGLRPPAGRHRPVAAAGTRCTIESEGTRISITCGRSSFTLPTLPVEDYPQLPVMPTTSGSVAGAAFAAAVAQVAIAAGRDDTLPTLTGIRMEIEGSDDRPGRDRSLSPGRA